MAALQGDLQDKGIPLGRRQPQQQPAEGNGHDEQVDHQEIQGQQPHGREDMPLIGIFHDCHVKLPGQEHDGPHAQQGLDQHQQVTVVGAGVELQESQAALLLANPAKDFLPAVKQAIGHQKPDSQKSHQLYE